LGFVLLFCGVLAGCGGSGGGSAEPAPTDPPTTTTTTRQKEVEYRRMEACVLRKQEAWLSEQLAGQPDAGAKLAIEQRLGDIQHAIGLLDSDVREASCSN
jgi:hypothetical protein